MDKRNNRFFHGILFRMSAWMLLLGLASILAVTYLVKLRMQNNLEKQIIGELQSIENNTEFYIRQILLINNCQIDESGFEQCTHEIGQQLENAGYSEVAVYDSGGKLKESSVRQRFDDADSREDFRLAWDQKSAFTIYYGDQERCEVYFTMPVEGMGRRIGMISYYLDYREMYKREREVLGEIVRVTVLAFAVIYIVVWAMLRRMVAPIRLLGRTSSDICSHLKDGQFDGEALGRLKVNERKDEIGELSRNYSQMLKVTKEQFDKIQEDRDHILQLLNSRQEFYNNVTHELKTPLTTISGYAQLMEENGLGDEELFYNGMEHILQESTRLHRMVVQLLEMQDKDRYVRMESLNITDTLRNVVDSMQMKARRYENALVLDGDGVPHTVRGREDRIRQVLINLIDNAIKYGKPGKEIWIRITEHKEMVQIAVANQGKGMSPEELKHIFEPFYRADKERSREMGSSGLGLAISKKIMEDHGGSIQVKSEPDGYTVFMVSFPEPGAHAGKADRFAASRE